MYVIQRETPLLSKHLLSTLFYLDKHFLLYNTNFTKHKFQLPAQDLQ